MSDWLSYRPADFLLFGPETYFRLFERWNTDWWPVHGIVTLGLISGLLLLLRQRSFAMRLLPAMLAIAWLWAAAGFLWLYYRPINLAVPAMLIVPALCVATLAILALRHRSAASAALPVRILASVAALSVLGDLVLAMASGRSVAGVQWPGNTPDTLAMLTLAWAALLEVRARWLVAIPAAIWLLMAWVTLATLDSVAAWWIAGGLLAGALATAWPRSRDANGLAPGSNRV